MVSAPAEPLHELPGDEPDGRPGTRERRRPGDVQGRRLLMVTEHAALGGAELSTVLAAEALAERGANVRLALARGGPAVARARAAGVPLLPGAGRAVPGRLRLRLPAILAAARWGPFDLVHVSSLGQRSTWVAEQALAGGRPTVAHLRHPSQLQHALSLHEQGAHLVTNSSATARWLREHGAGRVRFVPNGIEAERFAVPPRPDDVRRELGLRPSSRIALAVANIAPYKALDLLLDALTPALRDDPDLHLVHAGTVVWSSSGDFARRLADQVAASEVADRVHLLGARADVARLTAAADVALVPSRGEGTARAVLEAWAVGTPVVAAQVDGIDDLVRPGVDGLLVDLTDPAATTAAVRELLDDPGLAAALVAAGRTQVATAYSHTAHVEALLQVHADALAERA